MAVNQNVLARYPSSSNPAKNYNIIKGSDGITYCDCMGWKMNKNCKHLRNYMGLHDGVKDIKVLVDDPKTTTDNVIERIVQSIGKGGISESKNL